MKINGKEIAEKIIKKLQNRVEKSGKKPLLAILQAGNNPASNSYIKQKKKTACQIGIKVIHKQFPETVSKQELINRVGEWNKKKSVHAIIVQLPLPKNLNSQNIVRHIKLGKDVDGFRKNSPYTSPVASAVLKILQISLMDRIEPIRPIFLKRLRLKKIVVIGRGKTGGEPILKILKSLNIPNTLIHSKTKNPAKITKKADIIISCVGKPNIITVKNIKKGSILISVGIHRGKDKKLHGDYDEQDICTKAAFYTPTPGGVGPLTVACLMENVIHRLPL